MQITMPHPGRVLAQASFVPRWTRALALSAVLAAVYLFQQVVFDDGHVVTSQAACRVVGPARAGERINLPVACHDGAREHEHLVSQPATVLMFMRAGDRALRCDIMASGRVTGCQE